MISCHSIHSEFWNMLLEFGWFLGSMMSSDILFFPCDLCWGSGLLLYWIQKYFWGTLLLLFSELSPLAAWGTAKVVLLNSPWKLIYLSLSGHWPYHLGAITEYACPSSTYSWRTIPAILPIPEKLAWLSEPSQTFYFSLFWVDPFNDSTSLEIEPHEKQIDYHVVTYIPETIVFSLIWFPKKAQCHITSACPQIMHLELQ